MTSGSVNQILAVIRMELRKTFFSRRGLWIYLLAFAPVLLFVANSVFVANNRARLTRLAAQHPVSRQALQSVKRGASSEDVVALLGQPYSRNSRQIRIGPQRTLQRDVFRYTDGESDVT